MFLGDECSLIFVAVISEILLPCPPCPSGFYTFHSDMLLWKKALPVLICRFASRRRRYPQASSWVYPCNMSFCSMPILACWWWYDECLLFRWRSILSNTLIQFYILVLLGTRKSGEKTPCECWFVDLPRYAEGAVPSGLKLSLPF
jgi:hypothetical protein